MTKQIDKRKKKIKKSINIDQFLTIELTHPFQILKTSLAQKPEIRSEMETAMSAILARLNPSDRGTRFLTGGAYEWIIAVACWVSGIKLIPGGHSLNNFDLLEFRNALRGVWSIKSFTSSSISNDIRLGNKLSNVSITWTEPTL